MSEESRGEPRVWEGQAICAEREWAMQGVVGLGSVEGKGSAGARALGEERSLWEVWTREKRC